MLLPSTFLPKFTKMEQHDIYSPLQVDSIKPLHLLCLQPKQETEDILDFIFFMLAEQKICYKALPVQAPGVLSLHLLGHQYLPR